MIKLRYSPSLRHPICGAASCVSTHGLGVCDAVASGIARFIDQVVRRVRASSCKSLGHPLLPVRLFPLLRYTVYRTPVSARADHLHDAVSRTLRLMIFAPSRNSEPPIFTLSRKKFRANRRRELSYLD